jgi:hypothetical protein
MHDHVQAARVAKKLGNQFPTLINYTKCLAIIHRTPESDWVDLVERMLAGHWSKEQTEGYADVLKELREAFGPPFVLFEP